MRRQMLIEEKLPFPNGIATAETIREMYAKGKDAVYRIQLLLAAGVVSTGVKAATGFTTWISGLHLPAVFTVGTTAGVRMPLRDLGFFLEPSLMLVGFGAIVGMRVGIALFGGAILAWGILAPWILSKGWLAPEPAVDGNWYNHLLEWLLWPESVSCSSLPSPLSHFRCAASSPGGGNSDAPAARGRDARNLDPEEQPGGRLHIPWSWFWIGLALALVAATVAQKTIFDIPVWLGVTAVLLTFVLAIVAARVSGETGIPPIGALGKITQLTFGALSPGTVPSISWPPTSPGGPPASVPTCSMT